jgi:hypothetical protein
VTCENVTPIASGAFRLVDLILIFLYAPIAFFICDSTRMRCQ